MPLGSAWPNAGNLALWRANFKLNTQDKGFNLKFHIAEKGEVDAMTIATDLGKRIKALLPMDAEVFFATISRWDSKKDARYVPLAVGAGSYTLAGANPPPSVFDNARSAVLLRFEPGTEGIVSYKFAPIPDDRVAAGSLVDSITPVQGTPLALPALPAAGDAWVATFNNFLKAIAFQCHYVRSGYLPGGQYTYDVWKNMYPIRIGVKKGARVFSS